MKTKNLIILFFFLLLTGILNTNIYSQSKICLTEEKVRAEQLKNENLLLKQKALKDSTDKVQIIFQKQKAIDSIKVASINDQNTFKNERRIAILAAISKRDKTIINFIIFVLIGICVICGVYIVKYYRLKRKLVSKK